MASTSPISISSDTPGASDQRPRISHHLGAVTVLGTGILIQALNAYVTSSLMPDLVAEIGGEQFYAWVSSLYFVSAVIAAMLASRTLVRFGARTAFVVGFVIFAAGSVLAAVSPAIAIFLAARVLQGIGGGLLGALAFATVRTALPERLWTQGMVIVSLMYAVGTLSGPVVGGAFAEADAWRFAFVALAIVGLVLACITPRALPATPRTRAFGRIPLGALTLLALAVAAISYAGVAPAGWMWCALAVAALCIAAFVVVERASTETVLPAFTYRRGNRLKWMYLAIALSTAAVVTEAFTPLFGQRLIGLTPIVAGFLGATVSVGWSAAATVSGRASTARARRVLIVLGPALTVVAMLATAGLQLLEPSGASVLGWAVTLFIAGLGIGTAFPHLSVTVMQSTGDADEAAQAAAGVPIVSQIGQMLVVALGGVLVNTGMPVVPLAAGLLSFGIAGTAVLGLIAAVLSSKAVR